MSFTFYLSSLSTDSMTKYDRFMGPLEPFTRLAAVAPGPSPNPGQGLWRLLCQPPGMTDLSSRGSAVENQAHDRYNRIGTVPALDYCTIQTKRRKRLTYLTLGNDGILTDSGSSLRRWREPRDTSLLRCELKGRRGLAAIENEERRSCITWNPKSER